MSRHLSPTAVLVVAILWVGDVLIDGVELYLDPPFDLTGFGWGHYFTKRACLTVFWIVATLGALHVYGERPLELSTARHLRRSFAQAALAAVLVAAAYGAFLTTVLVVAGSARSWSHGVAIAWPGDVLVGFFRVWQIIIAVTAYHSYRQMLRRKRESEELKAQLQKTELLLFRAQLEPHFMFNTLNSIASLVRLERSDAATDALHRLSALLRGVLEVGERQVMPWQWERDFAETYLALQRLRFAERLAVEIRAPDVPAHAPVPILLLQPLLENAIAHGPLADGRRCEVDVALAPRGRHLELRVENEVAQAPRDGGHHGVGLANIRARLVALFGDDCAFEHRRDGQRFVVTARFPAGAS